MNIKHVDVEMVSKCLAKMKKCKAPGWDGIETEHLMHAHPILIIQLRILFNVMIHHSVVPQAFIIDWCFTARQHKIGQFVPIYQGDYWLRRLRIANEERTKQLHAIQWTYTCNDKQQVCLTCLKINIAYNKLHDPEWVKNTNGHSTMESLFQFWKIKEEMLLILTIIGQLLLVLVYPNYEMGLSCLCIFQFNMWCSSRGRIISSII